jgi:hypothetical protein
MGAEIYGGSKKVKKILISLTILILTAAVVFAEKPFLEYGGSMIYVDTTSYQDQRDYDGEGRSKLDRNVHTQLSRTYVTGYMNFSETSKIRLTLDSGGYEKDSDGFYKNSYVFVKYLYWEGKKIWKFSKVKVGQIGTPWVGFEDKIWGYRSISKSVLDKFGVDNSADRGLGVEGKLADKLSYSLACIGGAGYKWPDSDGKMTTAYRFTYELAAGLKASVGGFDGTKAFDKRYEEYYSYRGSMGNIHYKVKPLTLSYTFFGTRKGYAPITGVTTEAGVNQGKGSSVTAVYQVVKNIELIGRLDTYDADVNVADDVQKYSIIGVGCKPLDNVKLAITQQAEITEAGEEMMTVDHVAKFNAEIKF